MKNKILVRLQDYKRYTESIGSNKLDQKNEIYTNNQFPKFLNINEEIFEGRETNYSIIDDSDDKVLIKFESSSQLEYRLDLFKEPNKEIWHIGFSLFDSNLDSEYHIETNKNESIDVLSRVIWILKDINKNVEYCIGATGNPSKDNVYKYMMRFVSNWDKRNTDQYELGWAIYFKI